jgi:hypothetical protein
MIQRIQTIYLAIVAILLALPVVLEVSLASLAIQGGVYNLSPVTVSWMTGGATETVFGSFSIAAAFGLSLFLTIYAILQYKNRKFQMRLIQLAMLLQPIIGAIVFIYADKMSKLTDEVASVSYSPVLIVLLLNILLYYLALRGVKKDDALVRSADRLR